MMERIGAERTLRAVLLCALMLIGVFIFGQKTTAHAATQSQQLIFGDVNYDGKINDTDSLLVNRHIAAVKSSSVAKEHPDWILQGKYFLAANVNIDDEVDLTDLLMLQRHIAWYKGNKISKIVTVTLKDEASSDRWYDCFPIIYEANGATYYPYLTRLYRTGYTFQGWYTGRTGGERVSSYSHVKNMENHTLYARWSANRYTLSFDANGGSSVTGTKLIPYGGSYGTLPTPVRTGHTFLGWYTSKSGGNKVTSSTKMGAGSVRLYAHWSVNKYQLTYHANGGSCSVRSKKINYNSSYGSLPVPKRNGYTFLGWYTGKTGGAKVSSSTRMGAQDVTVYAQWKLIVPGKPVITAVNPNSYNKITVSWRAASDATHYGVFYKISGGSWKKISTLGSTARSFTHTSSGSFPIKLGQRYTYTVRAYNNVSKQWGSYDTRGVSSRTVPTTVKLRSARLNSQKNAVTISWNKAYGGDIYYVYRKTSSNSTWKKIAALRSNVLSYTDKKPVKGTTNIYTVRMYSTKAKVVGGYDKKGVSAVVPVYPGRVQLAQISSSNNSVKISWKKTVNTTHYKIYYKVPGGSWKGITQVGSGTTSFTHKGLTAGKKYYYVVKAYNSRFNTSGAYDSAGWGITVRGAVELKAPEIGSWKKTHDSATCNCRPHDGVTYTIGWKKVSNAHGYQVWYSSNNNGDWNTSYHTTTGLSFSDSFSHIDMRMIAKVRAYRVVNGRKIYGPWSREAAKTVSYGGYVITGHPNNPTQVLENYVRMHYRGYYYAIVDAGYNKEKVLIVTTAFRGNSHYEPSDNVGYPIRVYRYRDGKVRLAVNEELTQSISAGPWYYYKNKLYTLGRRGGYYRLDIFANGYERKFVNSYSSAIFADKNIVKLKKSY